MERRHVGAFVKLVIKAPCVTFTRYRGAEEGVVCRDRETKIEREILLEKCCLRQ